MKTYEQRNRDVRCKVLQKKQRRAAVRTAVILGCVAALALVLFLPINHQPPSVRQYAKSEYYDVIRAINRAGYQKPHYDTLFEKYFVDARKDVDYDEGTLGVPMPGAGINGSGSYAPEGIPGESYEEVTDNQVEGVIEGDLIKRSDKYIYYLRGDTLAVYTIAGDASELVGSYHIKAEAALEYDVKEMYVSEDCTTVTVLISGYGEAFTPGRKERMVSLATLDVTDPANIREEERLYLTGSYLSSRLVDGKLLLMSEYCIPADCNFDRPETFLPRFGTATDMRCIAAEDVLLPQAMSARRYTVVTMLDQKDLSVTDTAAFFGCSAELYVSQDHIFAIGGYITEQAEPMSEIVCVGYGAEGFVHKGGARLSGTVKNQYSMDEYEGVLRIVTSTTKKGVRNADLTCLSLTDWSVLAKVESFAPNGETVESVRFDGCYAYVCTAEVVMLTDPVYFFDLSDLDNITWKDTGTIDGYSGSLVNFGDFLLGIGYGATRGLKIEVYEETADSVVPVAVYERPWCLFFAEQYKAYLIDRENGLVGLGTVEKGSSEYLLLLFDGYELTEIAKVPMEGYPDDMRAVFIDGWLYVFGDSFAVTKIW